jgi:O-acetylhomoserine (thiol)-lyase
MSDAWSFETKQIHAGQTPDETTNARALPIYQTTSYTFNDTTHAANLFALKELGNIYTRIMNPTQATVEDRIAALEGGVGALLVSSGQAAETIAILNVAEAGDHIVSSPSLYGGTYNLFHYTLPKLGIEVSFVENPDDPQSWRDAIKPNTKAFFGESISNPKNDILDIETVAEVAHEFGVPLIVDNTVATPYLVQPLKWGADIVVHSATKYIGGHGTAVAGVIVDGGTFDYAQYPERYPNYNEPDPSYHGLVYARDLGVGSQFGANLSFILKARVQLLRDLGAAVAPFNAWLLSQGLETLSLRVERHVENAQAVAEWLTTRDEVEKVNYAGLETSPWYETGRKYAPKRHRCSALLRDRRGRGSGQGVRGGARTAQPRGQHRGRAQPGHPPRVDHALAVDARGAVGRGSDPRSGASGGRDREHRRHPRRPRRRFPRREAGLSDEHLRRMARG